MKNVFLVGHTGSQNRGCEAIVRSTVSLLNKVGVDRIVLATHDSAYDLKLGLDNICEIKKYNDASKSTVQHIMSGVERVVFHGYRFNERFLQKNIFDCVTAGDYVFVIGGDTYCYDSRPTSALG